MTWLRTPPEAKPDAQAAEAAGLDATVAGDGRATTAEGLRHARPPTSMTRPPRATATRPPPLTPRASRWAWWAGCAGAGGS